MFFPPRQLWQGHDFEHLSTLPGVAGRLMAAVSVELPTCYHKFFGGLWISKLVCQKFYTLPINSLYKNPKENLIL